MRQCLLDIQSRRLTGHRLQEHQRIAAVAHIRHPATRGVLALFIGREHAQKMPADDFVLGKLQ